MTSSEFNKHLSTAERFAALSRVGTALMSELDEARLLHLIAATACELTGATFAAFTLRPTDEKGQPVVPSEGNLFHLAAVVGVSKRQEELFRRMPLGGEGLLAPIFRYGVPVLVSDALAHLVHEEGPATPSQDASRDAHEAARESAFAHGQLPSEELRSMGVPRGHPIIRSFLGTPLLDRDRQVRGGLLLGHTKPAQFTHDDETLLVGLAAQAAVALENARLYRIVQMRAQELDAIFESIADGVTLVDQQGRILRENSPARRLRQFLQHRPDKNHMLERLLHAPAQQGLAGETMQDISVPVVNESGEMREYLVNASPLRQTPLTQNGENQEEIDRSVAGAVVVWRDVTEARRLIIERRVHAETEAHRALLQRILDELPGGVYLVRGPDARLVLANRSVPMVWGAEWKPGQPMGEFLKEKGIRIFAVNGHLLRLEQLATLRAVQQGETVRQHQEVIRHPDGTTLPVLVNAVALKNLDLQVSSALGDVQTVGTSELAALVVHQDVTTLKEAEHLKDEFIGIAAHELRNPLAILKGFAQTLLVQTARGKGPELADWQMEALQGIDQATIRMVELIDDLLDVTRLQAGRLALHREATDLVTLTRRVVTRLQLTTEQHTLILQSLLPHLVLYLDPRRMEQVLNNLLGNAIKYSPAGGRIEVSIQQDAQEQHALITVHDNGIGIPKQQQPRIFSRFVRADNAQVYGISGTGLGLYLCRELIEQHAGRIWFESAEGQGSTFFISLPVAPDRA